MRIWNWVGTDMCIARKTNIHAFRIFLLASAMSAATAAHAQQAPQVELEQITVEGQAGEDGLENGQTVRDPARTEKTQSYTTGKATIGGKGAVPLRQIPQSVSVITRQRIEDQNFTQLEDAARRTPGLLVLRNDPGRSSIFSRGFEFDQFSVDGLPAPMSSIYGTQPDLAIFDRIEVLRGPAALYSGNGEPGGSVNLARKRATDEWQGSVIGSVGSWSNLRTEVDASGALNEAGTVRGRIAGAFQDRESFVDINENQVWVGYGTLEFDITDATTLSIAAWHQEREGVPFNGLASFTDGSNYWLMDVPRSTFVGADWNTFDNATTDYLAELEHRLDNGGHIKAGIRYSERDANMMYGYNQGTYDSTTGVLSGIGFLAREYEGESLSGDVHLSTPFEAWGLEHNFLIGVDFRDYSETIRSNGAPTWPGGAPVVDLNNLDSNWPVPTFNWGNPSTTETTQAGIYSQLRLKPVEPLTVVLGGRLGWFEGTNGNSAYDETEFVPYAAAIYDVTNEISVYASYAETFQQQTGTLQVGGGLIGPRHGDQIEAGIKASLFGGAVNASLAVFQLNDNNRAIGVPGISPPVVNPADVRTTGFEAEIGGEIAEGWDVHASYANLNTEYTRHPSNADVFLTYWPEHVFNLWTKYTFQEPRLEGWHIAGGLKAVSSFYVASGGARLDQDAYVVVDAQVGYKINENLSAALTVTNLFDEKYYERVGSHQLFNFYGEPRAVNLSVKATF